MTVPDTRERLLVAARELFLERGYKRTTIGAIESHAGLAPRAGTFYRHFESKDDVLAEIARTEILERPSELGLEQCNGYTADELAAIAMGYAEAGAR